MMQYRITLDMLEFQGINTDNGTKTVNWTPISTFHLSPSRTIGRSKDGRVSYQIDTFVSSFRHLFGIDYQLGSETLCVEMCREHTLRSCMQE